MMWFASCQGLPFLRTDRGPSDSRQKAADWSGDQLADAVSRSVVGVYRRIESEERAAPTISANTETAGGTGKLNSGAPAAPPESLLCTGLIVNATLVLTSASCAAQKAASDLAVFFGNGSSGVWLDVATVIPFTPDSRFFAPVFDVALIRLKQELPETISPVPLTAFNERSDGQDRASLERGAPALFAGGIVRGGVCSDSGGESGCRESVGILEVTEVDELPMSGFYPSLARVLTGRFWPGRSLGGAAETPGSGASWQVQCSAFSAGAVPVFWLGSGGRLHVWGLWSGAHGPLTDDLSGVPARPGACDRRSGLVTSLWGFRDWLEEQFNAAQDPASAGSSADAPLLSPENRDVPTVQTVINGREPRAEPPESRASDDLLTPGDLSWLLARRLVERAFTSESDPARKLRLRQQLEEVKPDPGTFRDWHEVVWNEPPGEDSLFPFDLRVLTLFPQLSRIDLTGFRFWSFDTLWNNGVAAQVSRLTLQGAPAKLPVQNKERGSQGAAAAGETSGSADSRGGALDHAGAAFDQLQSLRLTGIPVSGALLKRFFCGAQLISATLRSSGMQTIDWGLASDCVAASLTHLDLSANRLEALPPARIFPAVRVLNLADNRATNLTGLSAWPQLKQVQLHGNNPAAAAEQCRRLGDLALCLAPFAAAKSGTASGYALTGLEPVGADPEFRALVENDLLVGLCAAAWGMPAQMAEREASDLLVLLGATFDLTTAPAPDAELGTPLYIMQAGAPAGDDVPVGAQGAGLADWSAMTRACSALRNWAGTAQTVELFGLADTRLLSPFSAAERLSLSGQKGSPVQALSGLPALRELSVAGPVGGTLADWLGLVQIEDLRMNRPPESFLLAPGDWAHLEHPALKVLEITGVVQDVPLSASGAAPQRVPGWAGFDLPALQRLVLRGLGLSGLPEGVLRGAPRLRLLDVRDNQFQSPEALGVTEPFPGLVVLLDGNPLAAGGPEVCPPGVFACAVDGARGFDLARGRGLTRGQAGSPGEADRVVPPAASILRAERLGDLPFLAHPRVELPGGRSLLPSSF